MPVIVIAGALLAQGRDALSAQHLLDALDFDESNIVKIGQGESASIYFGQQLGSFAEAPESAKALQGPQAQELLAQVSERWESDPEALMLRSQMGLDGAVELIALETPSLAPARPRV